MFFFFNDTATTEIYTLSLHDALPIYCRTLSERMDCSPAITITRLTTIERTGCLTKMSVLRSEEHTSELQSRQYLVCRLLLEKKKERRPSNYVHSIITAASPLGMPACY